ncbi:MAG: hypothetical protein LBQ15_02510 [Clostridium sp.]|nr:hypothetical protein [Clostridium sp.]
MKRILEAKTDILTKGHQYVGFAASIASTHPDYEAWLADNYIQLSFDKDNIGRNIVLDFVGGTIFDSLRLLGYEDYPIKKNRMRKNEKEIIKLVRSSIDESRCICTYLDEYYVPDRQAYKNHHFEHDALIYGYDFEKNVIHILGYDDKGKYQKGSLDLAEFLDAFQTEDTLLKQVWLKKEGYTFDRKRLLRMLAEYAYSVDIRKDLGFYVDIDEKSFFRNKYERHPNILFGMDIYHGFTQLLDYAQKTDSVLDARAFCTLYEHKKCMIRRLETLRKYYRIDLAAEIRIYQELEELTHGMLYSTIKYRFTKRASILDSIRGNLDTVKELEASCMKTLLGILS